MPESASEIEDVVPDDVELSEESALDEDEDDVPEEVWMSLVKFGVASTPPPPRDDNLDRVPGRGFPMMLELLESIRCDLRLVHTTLCHLVLLFRMS